ncbi:MAG: hypothetical protein XU15_C0016G0060 [candidate division NC10 bacterium CSP1-5]|nr:MAG: hypothetical protein XU15_C0016G0060 [candidate division NC10 bacterium CSP1-5]
MPSRRLTRQWALWRMGGVTRMPSYEFQCKKCNKPFSVTLTIKEREAGRIACPTCGSKDAEPLLGSFFAKTSKKS